MTSVRSLLLACSAMTAVAALAMPASQAQAATGQMMIAQTEPPPPAPPGQPPKKEEPKKPAPAAKPPAPHPAPPAPKPPAPPPAVKPPSAPPPVVRHPEPPKPPAPQHPAPPPAVHHPAPPPPAAQPKPAAPPPPPAAQIKPVAPPPPPAAQIKPAAPPPPPAAQIKPAAPLAPAAQPQQGPGQPPRGSAGRALQTGRPAVAPPSPPTQARSAADFIRPNNQAPTRGVEDLRRERHEVREGNRTIITEGDRTIVREGDRTFIRHNEADRFAVDARDVRVMESGDDTISIIVRPDGSRIITTTDRYGRLLRRVRRDPDGREIVIIDNRFAGPQPVFFVDVPPPRWRGPRDRYILDGDRITRDAIWSLFLAPPIERLDRRYTLEEVRYSEPLRAYMPRIDLDIHFDSGSWQLTPSQVDRLAEIADGLNRAISRNPREVFLIEGHTDAVGSAEDNLSLSDRRAEAVAVALTEQFGVPPENLVTQGYGEEYLKVQTDGPSRENRRVAIRRITPLIDRRAGR